MRTIILMLLVVSRSLSYAQISKTDIPVSHKVGEFRTAFFFVADITYTVVESDTTYRLGFNNMEYKTDDFHSIHFKNVGGTLEELYVIFKQGFDSDRKSKNRFKLGDQEISVVTVSDVGIKYIEVWVLGKGYFRLESKRQLDKLFGKR